MVPGSTLRHPTWTCGCPATDPATPSAMTARAWRASSPAPGTRRDLRSTPGPPPGGRPSYRSSTQVTVRPHHGAPRSDRDRDQPRIAQPAMPHPAAGQFPDQAAPRHPRTGAQDRPPRARPEPAPPAYPATVTLSRAAPPSAHPPSAVRPAGDNPKIDRRTAGDAGSARRHTASRKPRRRGPSVAVRAKPTVHTDRPGARILSAMRPWTPRQDGPQRYKATHDGTEKKRPANARYRS